MHRFSALKDCIFAGHLATDLDSIAGSIAGAHLYDGTAVRCSEVNSETKWVLERWGFDLPPKVEDTITPDSKVCLVDFQQSTQLNPAIDVQQIVGVIDHHALQNATIVRDIPIYLDIRPWGSMCTILAHNYLVQNTLLQKNMAGLMCAAVLSDTLNLQSPTTTDMDAMIVSVLAKIAEIQDINQYAKEQFKAKSAEINAMSEHALIIGDLKKFVCSGHKVGFGVVETTDADSVIKRKQALLDEIPHVKKERGFDVLFFGIVDIVNMCSKLLVVGPREQALAKATFPDCSECEANMLDTLDKVSRKKQFIPPLTATLTAGFDMPAEMELALEETELVMDHASNGFIHRRATEQA